MTDELLTEDLLARLLNAPSPQAYLSQDVTSERSLADYVNELMAIKGIKRAAIVRASGLNSTVVYDIFAGKSKPGRNNAIMLAFGMGCSLVETQRLLKLAGVSELWPKVRRDAVIIWCIEQGFTRAACDDELWRFGERTLLGTGVLR